VFSRALLEIFQPDVEATARSPAEVVAEIAARGLRRAWLVGGGALAALFRSQGLITEHIVSIVPVILGAGVPLFASGGPRESLKLVESKSYPNGLMQLRYLRAA
jgi:dihydrofolate reductase